MCQGLDIQHFQSDQTNHTYRIQLTPISCDLDIQRLVKHLRLTEQIPNSITPFQYNIAKIGPGRYSLILNLEYLLVEPQQVNIEFLSLSGSLVVPVKKPNPLNYSKISKKAAPIVTATVSAITGATLVSTIALGATASLWSFIGFQQFVGYFAFLNIHYPLQTKAFFSLIQFSIWEYLPNPLEMLTEPLLKDFASKKNMFNEDFRPPKKFVEYEKTSFFIENGGVILVLDFILLIVLLLVLICKKIHDNAVFKWMKVGLRWNLIARTFLENGIPLFLATCLQLRIMKFEGDYLLVSTALTVASFVYIVGMSGFLLGILYKRENSLLHKNLIRRIYGTLYAGIVLKNSTSKITI